LIETQRSLKQMSVSTNRSLGRVAFGTAVVLAALLGFVLMNASRARAADTSAASEFYLQAIKAMGQIRQPKFIAYRLESTSDGLQLGLWTDKLDQVWLNSGGGTTPQVWAFRHRTFDYESELVNQADGRRYISARSLFDPTWYGALRAFRDGMFGSQDPALAHEAQDENPNPDTTIKTIGAVSVMGPAIYHVDDGGESVCPNGDAGHALHLTPLKADYRKRQLTDVIVNAQSMRFCMIRFAARGAGSGITNGYYEEHYADVGGYWVQTDGVLDGWWFAGLFRRQHGIWRYRLVDMTFPASLSPDTFARSAGMH
jgi:hypothetical protein